jgi:hypothetical protein
MKPARWFAVTAVAIATVAACKKAPPPEAQPAPPPPAPVATPAPVPQPAESAPVAETPAAPDDDISVPEDFEGEVAKSITEKNYKAELDKIDKEIASTPE